MTYKNVTESVIVFGFTLKTNLLLRYSVYQAFIFWYFEGGLDVFL